VTVTPRPAPVALIAPDKFKGSLTAEQVATALAAGLEWHGVRCRLLPLADGGDGSVAAAAFAGYELHKVRVSGATGDRHTAEIAYDGVTAVVEVANTCGLADLGGDLAPLDASSRGFGQAVRAALALRPRTIVFALGGSASTDGGAGMLAALGAQFLDQNSAPLPPDGRHLSQIARIDLSALVDFNGVRLVVATDVGNALTGPDGAAHVFGPQKGATPSTVEELDAGLRNLVQRCAEAGWPNTDQQARQPGAGSAGGLGFACALLGADRVLGAEYFVDLLGFDAAVEDCQLVITGEGRLDFQTFDGKLPAVVAARSRPRYVSAVVGVNQLPSDAWPQLGLDEVHAISDRTDRDCSRDPELSRRLLTAVGRDIANLHLDRDDAGPTPSRR
jgi:glycerate kinase